MLDPCFNAPAFTGGGILCGLVSHPLPTRPDCLGALFQRCWCNRQVEITVRTHQLGQRLLLPVISEVFLGLGHQPGAPDAQTVLPNRPQVTVVNSVGLTVCPCHLHLDDHPTYPLKDGTVKTVLFRLLLGTLNWLREQDLNLRP